MCKWNIMVFIILVILSVITIAIPFLVIVSIYNIVTGGKLSYSIELLAIVGILVFIWRLIWKYTDILSKIL